MGTGPAIRRNRSEEFGNQIRTLSKTALNLARGSQEDRAWQGGRTGNDDDHEKDEKNECYFDGEHGNKEVKSERREFSS